MDEDKAKRLDTWQYNYWRGLEKALFIKEVLQMYYNNERHLDLEQAVTPNDKDTLIHNRNAIPFRVIHYRNTWYSDVPDFGAS